MNRPQPAQFKAHQRSNKIATKSMNRTAQIIDEIHRTTGIRAAQGFLRLDVLLGTNGQYVFQPNAATGQPPANVTETRVRQADVFIATSLGFFLKRVGSATPAATDDAIGQLYTFPDNVIFPTTESTNLEVLYNSSLQITIGNQIVVQGLDLLQMRRVGMAQQGLQASQQAAAVGTAGAYQRSQWDGSEYGFAPLHQAFAFNGQNNQQINLILPTAINCTAAGAFTNYGTIIMRGVLAINASNIIRDQSFDSFMTK
jgi:hypothetical protein